jgi:hypothetical protein
MELIPQGSIVNKHRYNEILHRLCKSIRYKRPELWRRKNWLFYMTVPLHIALCLSKRSWKKKEDYRFATSIILT